MLKSRAEHEWGEYVNFTILPDSMKTILPKMLDSNPETRIPAAALLALADKELAGFLRRQSDAGRFSVVDEIDQLCRFLPLGDSIRVMPITEREALTQKLQEFRDTQGLPQTATERVKDLLQRIA
jgi:hypothetical protein